MSLDRQSVEKRDFPISRRGYEPEAVDQHLAQVADELDRLRRQAASAGSQAPAPTGPASIAAAASEQVRAIVEAAETSAAQIERSAREEADGIRRSAEAEAASTRQEAVSRSEDHVGKVSEATRLMLQRVDAMETELQALVESLRTGANRLTADLSLLQGNLGELYDATGSSSAPPPPAPAAPVVPADDPEPETAWIGGPDPAADDAPEPELRLVDSEPEPAAARPAPVAPPEPPPAPPAPPAAAPAAATGGGGGSAADAEGARLVALNMALNGQSRDETDRYLAENFDLPDRQGLLDEVYATVDG